MAWGICPPHCEPTEPTLKACCWYRDACEVHTSEVLGSDNFSEQSARGSSRNQDQSFAAGWQAVSGPEFVNDLRFQFARRTIDLIPNSHGPLLEIPGVVSFGQSPLLDSS